MFSGKQKAVAAFVISLLGGIATWAVAEFPDNDTVQQWGAIILGLVTIVATTVGVYVKKNIGADAPPQVQ